MKNRQLTGAFVHCVRYIQSTMPELVLCVQPREMMLVISLWQKYGEHSNIGVDMSLLDEGDGFEATFRHHSAKWHNNCRIQVSKNALERKKKALQNSEQRKASEQSASVTSPAKIRRKQENHADFTPDKKCFFCDTSEGTLHQAMTWGLHRKVAECAEELKITSSWPKCLQGHDSNRGQIPRQLPGSSLRTCQQIDVIDDKRRDQ